MIKIRFIIIDLVTRKIETGIKPIKVFLKENSVKDSCVWDCGIDQSTSCTGVSLLSIDSKKLYCLEVANEGVPKEYYKSGLIRFFELWFKNLKFRYLVMEEPLPFITGHQNMVLVQLKRDLVNFFENSKLEYKKFDLVKPQSWRSGLIGKDNPNVKNSKMATVWEVERTFPEMKNFRDLTFHPTNESGYDGFESLGIIKGYLNRFAISNDDELVKIIGPLNTTKVAVSVFIYDNPSGSKLKELLNDLQLCDNKLNKPVLKLYNEEQTVYGNSKMSLVDDYTITVVTKVLDRISIMHLKQFDFNPKGIMYMVTIPRAILKDSGISYLKEKQYKLEIFY